MIPSLGAALVSAALAASSLGAVQWGNELTLPAQRHLVRLEPAGRLPSWIVAIQRDAVDGHALAFFRSDDDGASWSFAADIQPDRSHRDTADLVVAGDDVALVWSYEDAALAGSAAHDVWFQWWRLDPGTGRLLPEPAVRVFDSTSSTTAYSRAALALDSAGRLWVLAFRLESDGRSTAVVSVSTDGGASFVQQPALETLPARGGGRLLATGGRLVALYDAHDAGTPARFRVRDDSAPISDWSPSAPAFPEGIYHGAALSTAPDGAGGAHVVYKGEDERLYYRRFDGARFSAATVLVTSGDWALQPAVTRIGGSAVVLYNKPIVAGSRYTMMARIVSGGSVGGEVAVDSSATFKAYPAAAEELPTIVSEVPVLYASQPADGQWGNIVASSLPWTPTTSPPPPPPPPPPSPDPGTVLFSDAFDRTAPDLGSAWAIRGGYRADGNAVSVTPDTPDRATAVGAPACLDCRAAARVQAAGAAEAGLFVRGAHTTSDRYDLILLPDGRLRVRRLIAGKPVVIAEGPSGLAAPGGWTRLALSAAGAGPVTLVAEVDGVEKLHVVDSSAAAITTAGQTGLWTYTAGVRFDDFVLSAIGLAPPPPPQSPPPPPPPPPPGPGTVLFSDAFDRTASDLGPSWAIRGVYRADGNAVSVTPDTPDRATAVGAPACADCRVEARVRGSGAPEAGLFLRGAHTTSDRYDLILTAGGRLQLRRLIAGRPTVLVEGPSGLADPAAWTHLALSASGAGPVTLVAEIDGVEKLRTIDGSATVIAVAGQAGLWTYSAGVRFDDFVVTTP